jgi:hypothetical protein
MIRRSFHLWLAAAFLAGTALCAGEFAPPAEGPVAFRRDRIPLDADMMASLSRQLVTLAEGLDAESAANRRTAAQMLALSSALDPGNSKARDLISTLQKGARGTHPTGDQIEKSQDDVWQVLEWLEQPAAGRQAQALAACLIDVMRVSDPESPQAAAHRADREQGAWKGWIPPLSAYEKKVPVEPEDPAPTSPAVAVGTPPLEKARINTVLWKPSGGEGAVKWTLGPAALEMSATVAVDAEERRKPFSLTIGTSPNGSTAAALVPPLLKVLKKQHGALPAGRAVAITGASLDESLVAKKRLSISGAAAILASSAISGREPDAVVIGLVDEQGHFKLPTGFWNQLQALGPGTGARLVLPAAAADHLPSMLALERPEFFAEYEVLIASNFKELLDLTAKAPDEPIAKPLALFRELREKGSSQPLRQYVANPFIRRRLAELSQEAPYHVSAKMLGVQGAGNRPAFISRLVLCSELRRAIEPMGTLVSTTPGNLSEAQLEEIGATFETCKSQTERLFRYAEKADRDLISRTQDMITTLRPLDRAAKSRGETYEVLSAVTIAHSAVVRAHNAMVQELSAETGDLEAASAP